VCEELLGGNLRYVVVIYRRGMSCVSIKIQGKRNINELRGIVCIVKRKGPDTELRDRLHTEICKEEITVTFSMQRSKT